MIMNCIEIINTDFELLGIITNFESLICVWNYYECGTFELTINKNKANTNKLKIDNMLIVNKNDEKILLIDKVITETVKNSKTLKVTGTCIKGITKRRIIATNGYDRVSETQAENIIKHYIKNHLKEKNIAINVVKRILNSILDLSYLPEKHVRVQIFNEKTKNVRKMSVNNYLVIYEVKLDTRTSFYSTYFS